MDGRAHRTVLVLGGGGGRGAAQLGILRALAGRGIEPDACVGTSVGALNAAVCAALPMRDAVRELEAVWASPFTREVFRSEWLRVAVNRVRRLPWLRSGDCIRALVDYAAARVGLDTFEQLQRPLHIILTDLLEGVPVVASSGPLREALAASCAIPGVFPPVSVGGRLYVDGGVTDNCSLSTAAALGAERVIAIDLTADHPLKALRSWSEVVDRVMQVALHARVVADFDRFSPRMPVTLILPRAAASLRRPRFTDFVALREAAAASAERLLQRIATPEGLRPGVFYLPVGASAGPLEA